MNQLKFNTKRRNFKHLSEYERGDIYAIIKLGCSISSIARNLKRSRTTIYNELKRGRVEQIKKWTQGHSVLPRRWTNTVWKKQKKFKKEVQGIRMYRFYQVCREIIWGTILVFGWVLWKSKVRKKFGHWEIDTVIGKKTSDQDVLLTIIERKSRYYKVIKIDSKSSKPVNDALLDYIMESKKKWLKYLKA